MRDFTKEFDEKIIEYLWKLKKEIYLLDNYYF